ncbi:MAG: alkaline phosphatase family protein [Candidatus Limnocylindrales bacterium]
MRRRRSVAGLAAVALCAALALAACGSGRATPTSGLASSSAPAEPGASAGLVSSRPSEPGSPAAPTPAPSPTPPLVPDFRHVYVIVMENKEYSSIVGSAAAPYINSLIARYGLATNFYGETHPSEPNYIAMTSGGLQGTNSDGHYDLDVSNLFDQIEASGRTWHVYAQGYPGHCYTGSSFSAGVDGLGAAGEYARKHNPAISYTSISGNPTRCAAITGLAGFDPAAADFEFIAPNQINDMHSSSTGVGDAWLKTFVPQITDSAAFAGSVLFITWDEGDSSLHGGGHIATIAVSPGIPPGSRQDAQTNHYSLLRTVELAWGMPFLGQAGTANTLIFPW